MDVLCDDYMTSEPITSTSVPDDILCGPDILDDNSPSSGESEIDVTECDPIDIDDNLDVKPSVSDLLRAHNMSIGCTSEDSIETSSLEFNSNLTINGQKFKSLKEATDIVISGHHECYFTTDHLALQENSDYRKLLYAYLVQCEMQAQAMRDLDSLYDVRDRALGNPIAFVERLQQGEDVGLPKRSKFPETPVIDLSRYNLTGQDGLLSKRQTTRLATKFSGHIENMMTQGSKGKMRSVVESSKTSKSSQPWTSEEQKHLEQLLLEYPPEEIETRRWEKIAKALTNRTPVQVASRVQKYFIKLMKAGLPIPGRQPNSSYLRKPKRQLIRHQPSTFMVSYTPPVHINEDEIKFSHTDCFKGTVLCDSSSDVSDEDDIDPSLHDTKQYQEMLSIKRVLKKKRHQLGIVQHFGFSCAYCEFEPIIGVRWHCTDCSTVESVDFCEDCVNNCNETESHKVSHTMKPIRQPISSDMDADYMQYAGNYLHPNYMSMC